MGPLGTVLLSAVCALLLAERAVAATKTVEVGPGGSLTFSDQESGTDTTTVMVGDTVRWVWQSSGHSTTRSDSPETWDSNVQQAPFAFTHRFMTPGTYPYHCTPHQFLGMTGTVVVVPGGSSTTTTTTIPAPTCTDAEAVARTRTAVAGQCDCAAARSHRSYVKCAAGVAKRAVRAGTLPRGCKVEVKRCAAQSTCGRPGTVTCCRTTARGVQQCSIKPEGACRSPRGGTTCLGDVPSCCDACGGATCPAPATTSTTTTTTLSATTTTTPLASGLCDGLAFCPGGICPIGTPTLCADGASALWVGTTTSPVGSFDVVLAICTSDGFVSGTFFCLPGSMACFGTEDGVFGTIVLTFDGVTIVFDPFIFADGSTCSFDGRLVGITMAGDFACVDPFGFPMTAGALSVSRCP